MFKSKFYKYFQITKPSGFGLIEVIVAMGLFVIIASGGVSTVLQGMTMNRLASDETFADLYAQEGIEAVRSLKNRAFTNLVTGTYGLSNAGNLWNFLGSNDVRSNFTRQIIVEPGQRNAGNIVDSGGVVDPDLFKITSNVTWNFTPSRINTATLVTYLTNFRKTIGSAYSALLIYGDTTTTPKYRTYDSATNVFSAELNTLVAAAGQTYNLKTSPTKSEAIAGYVTSAGVLNIMCFDGATWTQEWSTTVGGNGATKRFDIAYETTSGDAMVLYSTNAQPTNELAFRTKLGSTGCGSGNWAGAVNFDPVRTTGIIQWVKLAWDKRAGQNLITAIWADASADLSAAVWSGTAWGNEPAAATETSLERIAINQDIEDFDVEYESTSGDVMVVWANSAGSNGNNGVRYRTCTGGTATCTWNAVTTPPTFSDDATNLDLSANPNSDEMVFASIGNAGADLQIGYWSGAAWTNTANLDTSCNVPVAGSKYVATGWLISGATTRSVVTYRDQGSTAIDWYIGNVGVFTKQTDLVLVPAPAAGGYIDIQMDPINKDQLMYVIADGASDLLSKRLVMTAAPVFSWTNTDGVALELNLPQIITSPFAFAYKRI